MFSAPSLLLLVALQTASYALCIHLQNSLTCVQQAAYIKVHGKPAQQLRAHKKQQMVLYHATLSTITAKTLRHVVAHSRQTQQHAAWRDTQPRWKVVSSMWLVWTTQAYNLAGCVSKLHAAVLVCCVRPLCHLSFCTQAYLLSICPPQSAWWSAQSSQMVSHASAS